MPTITREYRIPDSIDKTGNTNVGPQLQAIINDPTKFSDGTRLVFPENGVYRADKGLSFSGRKNFTVQWEGAQLTTPLDQTVGLTITDGAISDPKTVKPGSYSAELTTAVRLPSFSQQVWYARGNGIPGGARASRRPDPYHVLLTGPNPFTAATGLTVALISPMDRGRTMLSLANCTDFAILDYHCVGPNERGPFSDVLFEAQHGLALAGCTRGYISGVNISHVWGDCIATMRSDTTHKPCSFIDFVFPNLHHNGRSGITIKGLTDWTFQKSTMRAIPHNAMNFEPNDPADHCLRGKISIGSWLDIHWAWFAANPYSNGELAILGDMSFDNLRLKTIGTGINPDPTVRWGPVSMTRLVATAPSGNVSGYAIDIHGCDGAKVRDNALMLQAGRNMRGVRTTHCTSVDVGGNDWAAGIGEWRDYP